MKIGILTFHRARNYGAVLQCYALQETLKQMGHDVWVINYRQTYVDDVYSIFNWTKFLRYIYHLQFTLVYVYLSNIQNRLRRKNNYEAFCSHYLHLTPECSLKNIPPDFDVYIVGSDQLWNSTLTGGIDKAYWGMFKRKKESFLISYAISTSIDNLMSLDYDFVKRSISNFNAISVREYSVKDYLLKERIGKNVTVCLDPTLIANKTVWDRLITDKYKDKRYVLIYQARPYKPNPQLLRQKALQLSQSAGLEVIDLSSGIYTPEEFVSLFRYATCIITSSFHAVVFSVIFKRKFFAIALGDGHDERYTDLLTSLSLKKTIVAPDFIPDLDEIDYNSIDVYLSKLRSESVNFLDSNIC